MLSCKFGSRGWLEEIGGRGGIDMGLISSSILKQRQKSRCIRGMEMVFMYSSVIRANFRRKQVLICTCPALANHNWLEKLD